MTSACCFTGWENPGEPKGREDEVHGRPVYIAEPAEGTQPKGIIVMIPDAFGWQFNNNKIWADHIAAAGDWRVYLPEFMDGHAAPVWMIDTMSKLIGNAGFLTKVYSALLIAYKFIPFLIKTRSGVSYPRVTSFMKAVRENEGASLPIAAAGFCWGGQHVMSLARGETASNGKPLVDACFTAHPSNLSIPADFEKTTKPVSIAIGDKDFVMPMKQIEQAKKIWAGKSDVETEIRVYPDALHGFAVRADLNTPEPAKKAEEAEKQAVEWFKKQFAKVSY